MNKKIFILLDRSGSMNNMWAETIGSINGYVKAVEGDADVMLATFDNLSYDVIRNTTISNWNNVSAEEVTPRGGTPLLDSATRIMWNMIDSKAERAILVVITDGQENNSVHFKSDSVKSLSKLLTEKYNYDIVFLGANFDKISDVSTHSFGINNIGKFATVSTGNMGAAAIATATGTSSYLNTGNRADNFYSTDLKNNLAGNK